MTDYLSRVRRGAEFLEEYQEGVTSLIDIERLDVADGRFCPGAQAVSLALHGELGVISYWDAADLLCDDTEQLAAMGFDLYLRERREYERSPGRMTREYERLTEAWRAVLTERRT